VSGRRLWALVTKDLQIHGRAIAAAQVFVVGLPALAFQLRPADPSVQMSLVLNVNLIVAALWGEWLISREKTKGTLAWLRTLPVSDTEIVAAKWLVSAACILTSWTTTTLIFFAPWVVTHWADWGTLALGLILFGSLGLACRWRFGQKVGQALPFVFVGTVLIAILALDDRVAPALEWLRTVWATPLGRVGVGASLLLAYGAVFWLVLAWVTRSDTTALVE
jgi:hypothetical protein